MEDMNNGNFLGSPAVGLYTVAPTPPLRDFHVTRNDFGVEVVKAHSMSVNESGALVFVEQKGANTFTTEIFPAGTFHHARGEALSTGQLESYIETATVFAREQQALQERVAQLGTAPAGVSMPGSTRGLLNRNRTN
jgi:hypothetical protein